MIFEITPTLAAEAFLELACREPNQRAREVFKPLSSRDALTPSVLMLLPTMAWYFSLLVMSPVTQRPEV